MRRLSLMCPRNTLGLKINESSDCLWLDHTKGNRLIHYCSDIYKTPNKMQRDRLVKDDGAPSERHSESKSVP